MNCFLELNFDVLHGASNNRYADDNDIRLLSLGPIALFSKYKLATSSGKHLGKIENGHIACLMYKLLTTARGCDDLCIGFGRSPDSKQREIINNKKIKGKYLVRIYLKDIFGFAEHQLNGTYGLGYILTATRNIDNAILNKDNAINNAKIEINSIHWYVPQYTPSIAKQAILIRQIQSKTPTEVQFFYRRSISLKEVNTESLWNFELGTQVGINVPIWIFVGFQQMDRPISQILNNDSFLNLL